MFALEFYSQRWSEAWRLNLPAHCHHSHIWILKNPRGKPKSSIFIEFFFTTHPTNWIELTWYHISYHHFRETSKRAIQILTFDIFDPQASLWSHYCRSLAELTWGCWWVVPGAVEQAGQSPGISGPQDGSGGCRMWVSSELCKVYWYVSCLDTVWTVSKLKYPDILGGER